MAAVLFAAIPRASVAWVFDIEDVHSMTSATTVVTRDYHTGHDIVAFTSPSGFYISERGENGNWTTQLITADAKYGLGTICLSNWAGAADSYRPTIATIRASDGAIVQWYRGGDGDQWYLNGGAGNGLEPAQATRVSMASIGTTNCFAYTRTDAQLWFRRDPAAGSQYSTMIAAGVASTPSLFLDKAGLARIVYRDAATTRLVYAQEGPGSTWTTQFLSPDDGETPCLRLDSSDQPRIAYRANDGLMYAEGSGFPGFGSWNVEIAQPGPMAGIHPSLRLTGGLEFPWIASTEPGFGSIFLTQRLGPAGDPWASTSIVGSLDAPEGASLFIDGVATPKVSFSSALGGVDIAEGGVWVARIQDQGLEGQTFKAAWGGAGPVIVETSTDGGTSYQTAVETNVSPAFFTLPSVQTNAARVRIRRASDGATAVSPNTFRIVPRTTPPNPVSQARWAAPGSGPERRGYALADAGDVNGDGYDDVIAGAPLNASAGPYTGRAYLYFGGPASDAVADLTLNGPEAGSLFGISVSGVGDLNHDGYADFAVGAPYFTLPAVQTGRVYVYFGGPLLDATADLVLSGTALGETFGQSVAGLGDVNGDGYDDLAVGAPAHDGAGGSLQNAGRVDLFFGAPTPDGARDMSVEGAAAFDEFGYSVGGGGDVNGDGAPDFVVGAHYGDGPSGTESGTVYLFLGGRLMDGLADVIQRGTEAGGQLGYSVAIVGDVNGDGLADIAAGAPDESDGGRAYLWGGSSSWVNPGPPDVSVNPGPPETGVSPGPPNFGTNPGPPDMVLTGESGDQLGVSVAGLGDLNGDCFADVGFGAPAYGGDNQGRAYVVLGGTAPDPGARVVLEGRSGEGLGGSMAGLWQTGAGSSARLVVSGLSAGGSRSGDGGLSLYDFARFIMQSPSGGGVWPVGALREIRWLGREPANIELSTDGGATWTTLLENVGGQGANVASIRVPHTPTKFARIRATPPSPIFPPSPIVPPSPILPPNPVCMPEAWTAVSDSFFTIQTSVSLLALLAAPAPNGAGAVVTWNSDPGPQDLTGYRLDRATGSGAWTTVAPLTRETSYTDPQAGPAMRYRLFAVNGFGEELMLGETSFRPRAPLAAWPLPYRGGEMSIAFATHGGWGGGAGRSEVTLFDVRGRLVRKIADAPYEAGYQTVAWDGRDERGQRVATGMYFLRSKSAGEERTLKVVVAR